MKTEILKDFQICISVPLREIRKIENNVKTSWNCNLVPSLLPKKKILSILAKDSLSIETELSRSALFHVKTKVFLKYFVRGCLWKQVFASNLPQAPSNLICLAILVTLRSLTQF